MISFHSYFGVVIVRGFCSCLICREGFQGLEHVAAGAAMACGHLRRPCCSAPHLFYGSLLRPGGASGRFHVPAAGVLGEAAASTLDGAALMVAAGAGSLAAGVPIAIMPAPLLAAGGLAMFLDSNLMRDYLLFVAGSLGSGAAPPCSDCGGCGRTWMQTLPCVPAVPAPAQALCSRLTSSRVSQFFAPLRVHTIVSLKLSLHATSWKSWMPHGKRLPVAAGV